MSEKDTEQEEEQASVPLSELRSEVTDEPERPESDESVPLSGLRDAVRDRSAEDSDAADAAFVEEEPEPVDTASVWADLLADGHAEGQFSPTEGESEETQVIAKHICERCQYLAAPPDLRCTHDGTTIHELVDVEHVRVSACPMVGPDGETRQSE
jgi:hypothetical protein